MTEQRDTPERPEARGPFTRPAFLVAAAFVLVTVLVGVVVAVRVSGGAGSPPQASRSAEPSGSGSQPSTPTAADPKASTCGLGGHIDSGTVEFPPAATWRYEGATAYPTSPEYGPGADGAGYRYCFQYSPTGAVFATANALAPPEDLAVRRMWISYFISSGPNKDNLLEAYLGDANSTSSGVRLRVQGFKILFYEQSTARIDIAVEASGTGQTITASYVYELVWQAGDWKLNSDAPTPFNFSTVPNADGYVPWSP